MVILTTPIVAVTGSPPISIICLTAPAINKFHVCGVNSVRKHTFDLYDLGDIGAECEELTAS